MTEEKGLKDAEEKFIECIIDHKMWDSEAFWKTVTNVTTGLESPRRTSATVELE